MLMLLKRESELLESKSRFISYVLDGTIIVKNVKKEELIMRLKELGFKTKSEIMKEKYGMGENDVEGEQEQESEELSGNNGKCAEKEMSGFNYLLGMTLWQLTNEKVHEFFVEVKKKKDELDALMRKTVKDLWREDLLVFREKYEEDVVTFEEERQKEIGESAVIKEGMKGSGIINRFDKKIQKPLKVNDDSKKIGGGGGGGKGKGKKAADGKSNGKSSSNTKSNNNDQDSLDEIIEESENDDDFSQKKRPVKALDIGVNKNESGRKKQESSNEKKSANEKSETKDSQKSIKKPQTKVEKPKVEKKAQKQERPKKSLKNIKNDLDDSDVELMDKNINIDDQKALQPRNSRTRGKVVDFKSPNYSFESSAIKKASHHESNSEESESESEEVESIPDSDFEENLF